MVLDSSAIVALVLGESESPRLQAALQEAEVVLIGAPTLLECSMVLIRVAGPEGRIFLRELLTVSEVEIIPFTAEHELVAYDAFLQYGKGRHPAALNFGDCMAYSVAKVSGEPLLFVGSDFSQTDIAMAGPSQPQ